MKRTLPQIRNCILFRQFLIPEGNCQLPDQNYAADQTAKDKVECNNTYARLYLEGNLQMWVDTEDSLEL